jgi:hypothetical protein
MCTEKYLVELNDARICEFICFLSKYGAVQLESFSLDMTIE